MGNDCFLRSKNTEAEPSLVKPHNNSKTNYTIALIGSSGVGKTSLYYRFLDKKFEDGVATVTSGDFRIKEIPINGQSITIKLVDTAGEEKYHSISHTVYRADAFVVVFDVSKQETFDLLQNWISNIEAYSKDKSFIIVGNKIDLTREVNTSTAKTFADSYKCLYLETSAKTGQNVDDVFVNLIKVLLNRSKEDFF
eukprot:TRINITY_DN644_c0_g1_i1.p1 TRINITY_DN644_c0_g1~~TRINITY_DN644_c0_g1_i1.p1  ORF type:complete len:205 (-),score=26.85 TRINITY_DN644_c0_g1_i1:35-619(-)